MENFDIIEQLDRAVVIALGTNPIIEDDINKIYNSDKEYYYGCYKRSPFYRMSYFDTFSVSKVEGIQKACAIYQNVKETHASDVLERLLKKGYKRVYNSYKNLGLIDIWEVFRPFQAKLEKQEHVLELDMVNTITAAYALASILDAKVINAEAMGDFYTSANMSRALYGKDRDEYMQTELVRYKDRIKELRKKYLPLKHREIILEDICEFLVHPEHMEFISQYGFSFSREDNFKRGFKSRFIGAISGVFKNNGIFEDVLNEYKFTQNDLDLACLRYIHAKEFNDLDEVYAPLIIYATLYAQALVQEYKYTRQAFLETSQEEYEEQLKLERGKFLEDSVTMRKELEQLRAKLKVQEEETEKHIRKIEELESENKQLRLEKKEITVHSKEVHALRNLVYQLNNEEEPEEVGISTEQKIEALKARKIAVIGGSQKWINKLSSVLDNAVFKSPDAKGHNLKHLNVEGYTIFINTRTAAHTMYEKLMGEIEKDKIDIVYINNNYGLERTIHIMYSEIQK